VVEATRESQTSAAARDALVSVREVSMIYRTRDPSGAALETVALKDANLEIMPGEFISLIGPSGCGKTTLLRLLADLIQPTSGELRIGGKTAQQARESRAYGYVFQAPALFEWRTVMANVMLPLEIMGYSKEERISRAQKMLSLVGLEKFARNFPWQLSGGMQQRASIARALAFDPQLIFMDEPFGALDEITRENLNLELLRLWRETGKTVIFVTHSIPEAVFLSTRIVVMTPRPGKIEKIIDVDLPQPRGFETRESARFFEIATEVRESLKHGHGYEVEV
jgi:NitT/TauT family transport system ATP-binding protein